LVGSEQPLGHIVALHTHVPFVQVSAPRHPPLAAFCHWPIALQNWGVLEPQWFTVGLGAHALHAPW
jgi:hypothetical protein